MIDTHCHLTDERLQNQLDDVLTRAWDAGVRRMITIGTDIDDSLACVEVATGRKQVRCAVGVHPNYVANVEFESLALLRSLQLSPAVVALGEIGLDYHYGMEHVDRQRGFFLEQLRIAAEFDRPVVIHCRQAVDDALAILRTFPSIRADFHCFTGSVEEARRILDAGHLIGYTGPITYKKSDALREAVALTPLDRLLVETDAPYLTPEPMRKQKVNEPALVTHVALQVATIKNISYVQVEQAVEQNAARFFGWPP